MNITIFDLDGTLADIEHRRHLVAKTERGPAPNWDEFYARCVQDAPIEPVVNLFRMMYRAGRTLEIWSGRSAAVRRQTEDWLHSNLFRRQWSQWEWREPSSPRFVRLRLRPEGDYTPDEQLKERWLDHALAEGTQVELVIDDRAKVVSMWRRRGLTCLQCAPGEF